SDHARAANKSTGSGLGAVSLEALGAAAGSVNACACISGRESGLPASKTARVGVVGTPGRTPSEGCLISRSSLPTSRLAAFRSEATTPEPPTKPPGPGLALSRWRRSVQPPDRSTPALASLGEKAACLPRRRLVLASSALRGARRPKDA